MRAEIVNRYAEEKPAAHLVYAPIGQGATYQETRVYDFDWDGDDRALKRFVRTVLSDKHAQEVTFGVGPAIDGAAYHVDVAMKSNVLDLEKEYLLAYYRTLEDPGFDMTGLTIRRRIYIFGDASVVPPEVLVRDLVNPVIQESTTSR